MLNNKTDIHTMDTVWRFERYRLQLDYCDCILWTASQDSDGYGSIRIGGKLYKAHRVAYEIYIGEIPKGMLVCHTCDRPDCINPKHLFLGTKKTNAEDRDLKGRGKLPYEVGREYKHIITEEQEESIKLLYATGLHSQREIAEQYNVSIMVINRIVNNKYRRI